MPEPTHPAPDRAPNMPDELIALIVPILQRPCPKCTGKRAPIGDDVNCATCLDNGNIGPVYIDTEAKEYARRILSAVLPEHERQVRRQVAAEARAAAQAIEDTRGENPDPLAQAIATGCRVHDLAPAVFDDARNIAIVAYRHLADQIARGGA